MGSRSVHVLVPWQPSHGRLADANLASIRLRSAIAVDQLSLQGHRVTVGEVISDHANVVLVGKIGAHELERRSAQWLDQINQARQRGARILLDYTDHHLGFDSMMNSFYKPVMGLADNCITSSNHLRKMLQDFFPGEVHVIADPVEISPVKPKKLKVIRTVLWFGHASNIGYLMKWVENLSEREGFNLIVLTNSQGMKIFADYPFRTGVRIEVKLLEWSITNMIRAAEFSDFCVIPSDPTDPRKSGASSNRLLTSLALGLPTAASMLPSYQEFAEYFHDLDSDPTFTNISDPEHMTEMVIRAQRDILPGYSIQSVCQRWTEILCPD